MEFRLVINLYDGNSQNRNLNIRKPIKATVFLGTKFPKSLKTAMTAFVLLESPENEENILKKDHFCHGLNAYMQVC